MDLRYVYTFYRAAMLSSVTATAEELRIVPRAVWKRIDEVENALGTNLVERSRDKHFRLTPAGTRFMLEAESLMMLWTQIKNGAAKGAPLRALRVGAIESVLHSWLIPWVGALRREQPALQLELTVETTPTLLELMRRGALDIALASLPLQADGVHTRALDAMKMVFVASQSISAKRIYTLEQLAKRDLLTFQRSSQPHLALLDRLRSAGLHGARVHAISSISAMLRLAADDFGIATLPELALDRVGPDAAIRIVRCSTSLDPLPIHVSWMHDPRSTALDDVVEHAIAFQLHAGRKQDSTRTSRKADVAK